MSIDAGDAARFLLANRTVDAVLPDGMPEVIRPRTLDEAVAIQHATLRALGPIGGWKVGADHGQAIPVASPLPASGIVGSATIVASRLRAVEAEISFRFRYALPPRSRDYDRGEVLAAIGSCQGAIEIIDPRFRDRLKLDPLTVLADLGMHGGLVVGNPVPAWQSDMFATLPVELSIDGEVRRRGMGSNPGGSDLVRLLVWLANADTVRAVGGLAAGTVVTTGSWTGAEIVQAGGSALAQFDGFAPVEVRFQR